MGLHDEGWAEDKKTFAINPVTCSINKAESDIADTDSLIEFIEDQLDLHIGTEIKEACRMAEGRDTTIFISREINIQGRDNSAVVFKVDIRNSENQPSAALTTYKLSCTAKPDTKRMNVRERKINGLSRKNNYFIEERGDAPFTAIQLKQIESALDNSIRMITGDVPFYKIY
ncbi:hypothetical protein WA158_006495 [Blastocystis sp. Blastoise]